MDTQSLRKEGREKIVSWLRWTIGEVVRRVESPCTVKVKVAKVEADTGFLVIVAICDALCPFLFPFNPLVSKKLSAKRGGICDK